MKDQVPITSVPLIEGQFLNKSITLIQNQALNIGETLKHCYDVLDSGPIGALWWPHH